MEIAEPTPRCLRCSTPALGDNLRQRDWVIVRKTGQSLERTINYIGFPMGAQAQITGFQVELLAHVPAAVCAACAGELDESASRQFEALIAEYPENLEEYEANQRKYRSVVRKIWGVTSAITLIAIVAAALKLWTNSDAIQLSMIILVPLTLILLPILSIANFGEAPEKPDEQSRTRRVNQLIDEAQREHVRNTISPSEELKTASILRGDDYEGVLEGNVFAITLDRYRADQHNGFALFHLDKREHEPGGSRRARMIMSELREFAAPKNAGEWLCKA
jgi:hypothetical protein